MEENGSIPVRAEAEAAEARPVGEPDVPISDAGATGETLPPEPVARCDAEGRREAPQDKHKESMMIDVHVPHGGLHTWKDFWIHLGTITLGLLIAISLEQSVEWLHHLHQRHQLEASLLAECKINKDRAEANFSGYDDLMKWLLGLHRDIGRMLSTKG